MKNITKKFREVQIMNLLLIQEGLNINKGDYHSYSFLIARASNDKVANLLLSYQPDKSYKSFIVEYELSPQEFYAINSQDLQSTSVILKEINFDNVSVILESLNKSTIVSCTTTWKYTPDEGQLVGAGNDELAGWYVSS